MIEFALLVLALLCINMAFYSLQRGKVDEKLKALEKDILKEFNIKDK